MADLYEKNPNDADDKKMKVDSGAYKKIVKKQSAQAMAKDTAKPLSPTNPLMVQKADGSIGQWGNPLPPPKNPALKNKSTIKMSDKAAGYSNNFYPPSHQ